MTTSGADPDVTRRDVEGLRRGVLQFASAGLRDLPWRRTRDPWRVLVSEVMLQQTQVARVLEPYERFVTRFPTPGACAAAGGAEVVRAWAGLGYNRRALHLHRAATAIVGRHDGNVPGDLTALRALPGVGPCTSRAVMAFAFGADVGVVDANVARFLARAVAGRPLRPARAQSLADALVPEGRSWTFNQALLDLGARHCTARRPDCEGCPVRRRCRWAVAGWPVPDPVIGSAATARRQSAFAGSDRQGRGRLVAALRRRTLGRDELAAAAGWPDDEARALRLAGQLVAEGLAHWRRGELALA